MKMIVFALLMLLGSSGAAQITLPAKPSASVDLSFGSLSIEVLPTPHIVVILVDPTSNAKILFVYPCETPCAYDTDAKVLALINALNSANLTTRTLLARIYDRLVVDFPTRFPSGVVVK